MPGAREAVAISGTTQAGGLTARLNVPLELWAPVEQVLSTCTPKDFVPEAEGVPLMRPLLESASPAGRAPVTARVL